MYFSRILLIFTAATAVSAMTTHFGKRDVHHRRALAARQPEPVAATPVAVVPRIRKRVNGRCKASNATSSAVQATSSAAPENAGNNPPTFTSSPVEQTTATPTQETTQAPAPTTSKTPTPTTHHNTPTPSPTSGGGSSGGSSGASHSGDGTFYGTGLGSCGITNKDTDFIAAVSHILYDSFPDGGNPNNNPVCNRKATATYQGKSVTVTITDRCVGCAEFDLDFSPSAFSQLADQSIGRIHGMTWHFDD